MRILNFNIDKLRERIGILVVFLVTVTAMTHVLFKGPQNSLMERDFLNLGIKWKKSALNTLNYGVVLDCGSSGTRLYVYRWWKGNRAEQKTITIEKGNDKMFEFKQKPGNFIS
jgi:hypothetical protein